MTVALRHRSFPHDMAFGHHDEPVPVFHGVAQIVSGHDGGETVLLDDLIHLSSRDGFLCLWNGEWNCRCGLR